MHLKAINSTIKKAAFLPVWKAIHPERMSLSSDWYIGRQLVNRGLVNISDNKGIIDRQRIFRESVLISSGREQDIPSEVNDYTKFVEALNQALLNGGKLDYTGLIANLDWHITTLAEGRLLRDKISQLKSIRLHGSVINSFNDVTLDLEEFMINGVVSESFNRSKITCRSMTLQALIQNSFNRTYCSPDTFIFQETTSIRGSFHQSIIRGQVMRASQTSVEEGFQGGQIILSEDLLWNGLTLRDSFNQMIVRSPQLRLSSDTLTNSFVRSHVDVSGLLELKILNATRALTGSRISSSEALLSFERALTVGQYLKIEVRQKLEIRGHLEESFSFGQIHARLILFYGEFIFSMGNLTATGHNLSIEGCLGDSFGRFKFTGNSLSVQGTERNVSEGNFNDSHIIVEGHVNYQTTLEPDSLESGQGLVIKASDLTLSLSSNSTLTGEKFGHGSNFVILEEISVELSNRSCFYDFSLSGQTLHITTLPSSSYTTTFPSSSYTTTFPSNTPLSNTSSAIENSFIQGHLDIRDLILVDSPLELSFNDLILTCPSITINGSVQDTLNSTILEGVNLVVNGSGSKQLPVESRAPIDNKFPVESRAPIDNKFLDESKALVGSKLFSGANVNLDVEIKISSESLSLFSTRTLISTQRINMTGEVALELGTSLFSANSLNFNGPVRGFVEDTFINSNSLVLTGLVELLSPKSPIREIRPLGIASQQVRINGPYTSTSPVVIREVKDVDLYPDLYPGLLSSRLDTARAYPGDSSDRFLDSLSVDHLTCNPGIHLQDIQHVISTARHLIIRGHAVSNELMTAKAVATNLIAAKDTQSSKNRGIQADHLEILQLENGVEGIIARDTVFPHLRKLVLNQPRLDCFPHCHFPNLVTLVIQRSITPQLSLRARPLYLELDRSYLKCNHLKQPFIVVSHKSQITGRKWQATESFSRPLQSEFKITVGSKIPLDDIRLKVEQIISKPLDLPYLKNCHLSKNRVKFPYRGTAVIGWIVQGIPVEFIFHVKSS